MCKVRKILELCAYTMMITTAAVAVPSGRRAACIPVSIEHGFDLLTPSGRRKAEQYVDDEKPDPFVGEWMCGPFSSMQNINMGKSDELYDRPLAE